MTAAMDQMTAQLQTLVTSLTTAADSLDSDATALETKAAAMHQSAQDTRDAVTQLSGTLKSLTVQTEPPITQPPQSLGA